jgi:hypothetical protein
MNVVRGIIVAVFMLWMVQSAPGQTIKNYSTDNILSTNTVYGIFKLKNGSVLLCTNEGLQQYTGKEVVPYPYLNPQDEIKDEVFDIYEDERDRMWLSTFKATLAFVHNHYYHCASNDSSLARPVQLSTALRTIANKKNGDVLIYSMGIDTVYRYNGKALAPMMLTPRNFKHFSFDIDANADLIFYGRDRKVSVNSNKTTEHFFDQAVDMVLCKHLQCHQYIITSTHISIDSYSIPQPTPSIKPGPINSIIYDTATKLLYVCCKPGLLIYDTKAKATKAYLLAEYTVSDVCLLHNGSLLASTTDNGLFEIDLKSTEAYNNQGNAKFKDAKMLGNDVVLRNNNDGLFVLSNNLQLRKNISISSAESPKSFVLHKANQSSINILYGNTHYELFAAGLHKVETLDKITFVKKTTNFRNKILGVNHLMVFFLKPMETAFTSKVGRIFDIYNYKDSLILATTKNELLVHSVDKKSTTSLPTPFKIFKIFGAKHHCILQAHTGVLHYCTDVLDPKSYTKIARLPPDMVTRDIIAVNDSVLIILGQNTTLLLQDNKQGIKVSYLGATFLPRDVVNVFSHGQELIVLSSQTIAKRAYSSLLTPCAMPYLADVVVFDEHFNSKDTSVLVSKSAQSISVIFDIVNLDQYPCYVQYRYAGSPWAKLSGTILSIPDLRYGSSQITIQLCDAGSGIISQKNISVYRALPIWKRNWFAVLCICAGALLMFLAIRAYYRRRTKKKLQIQLTKFESLQNELKALNAMMNPHFVFNSLANIQAMYRMNEMHTADKYLNDFSALIRQNMRNVQHQLIPLSAELDVVGAYLALENLRFNNTLLWEINISDGIVAEEVLLPPLLLQPLVENSIKHGLFRKKGIDNRIKIDIVEASAGSVTIKVADNGIGVTAASHADKQDTAGNRLALKNIAQRIEHLNLLRNMNASLSSAQEAEWYTVQITL